jgi:hypothetical protein
VGDGPSARTLPPDTWGNPQKPFNFTKGGLKSGGEPQDVYRTFMTGLNGTAMLYGDIFAEPDGESIKEATPGARLHPRSERPAMMRPSADAPRQPGAHRAHLGERVFFAEHPRGLAYAFQFNNLYLRRRGVVSPGRVRLVHTNIPPTGSSRTPSSRACSSPSPA